MGSFGDRLRREREMRGISLDEIATATKISTRNLRALEEEKFKLLPGGIFNKGFVRAYAKFLGIDEEQMVAEYVAASSDTETVREQKLRNDLSKVDFRHDDEDESREISLEPKSQWGTIAVIVLVAVTAFGGWEYYQKRKAEQQAQASPPSMVTTPAVTPATPVNGEPAAGTSSAAPLDANSSATPGSTPNPAATSSTKPAQSSATGTPDSTQAVTPLKEADLPATGTGPIDVKIHANQDSWISITADGKTVMKGTLPAASEKAVRAKDQVVVVLGNAGGVEVSYNGKPVEIGKGAEVKKITFTPSGYE